MNKSFKEAAAVVSMVFGALFGVPCAQAQSRGELLYSTHCVTCHTTEIHWRDDKAATDWKSLKFQVRRWQGATGLGWSEADVQEVTRYLNDSIYRYPQSLDPTGAGSRVRTSARPERGVVSPPEPVKPASASREKP